MTIANSRLIAYLTRSRAAAELLTTSASQFVRTLLAGDDGDVRKQSHLLRALLDLPVDQRPASTWLATHLLEAPSVLHAARHRLLSMLAVHGIYRDLRDLPAMSGRGVAWLIATLARPRDADAARWTAMLRNQAAVKRLRALTTADAMLVGMLAPCNFVAGWRRFPSVESDPPSVELLSFAEWIGAVSQSAQTQAHRPVACDTAPRGRLWEHWLGCAAFRGPRRRWARRLGARAGAAGASELPGWLRAGDQIMQSKAPALGNAWLAMLIEWTLAAVRAWPDRRADDSGPPPEVRRRAEAMRAEVLLCAGRSIAGRRLVEDWLGPSLRRLLDE
ncbi:MAG TPA: hypothetical protein PLV92_27225, partial [Pirellulaceae bacterium]|nr:hypothetical protein [Pirellulaceae bacterium]